MNNGFRLLAVICVSLTSLWANLATPLWGSDGLTFYRVVKDKATYGKNPGRYDRVSPFYGGDEVYVERTPTANIPASQIKSVLLEKQGLPTSDALSSNFSAQPKYPYVATFYLDHQGGETLRTLTSKYLKGMMSVELNDHQISFSVLLEPIGSGIFSINGLKESKVSRLKEIFSPLEDKVTWK